MMKKTLLLACAAMVALAGGAKAQEVYVDGIGYSCDVQTGTAAVTYCEGDLVEVVIPASVEYEGADYPVTAIGQDAFIYMASLESVELPATLKRIGEWAFYGCSLTEVVCHAVTPPVVREAAFDASVYALASLTVPADAEAAYETASGWKMFFNQVDADGITYTVDKTAGTATVLYGGEERSEAVIHVTMEYEGADYPVTAIGPYAFDYNGALQTVELPEGLLSIGAEAFATCESLESINLPSTLTSIGDMAFMECYALRNVSLPEGLQYLGEGAFSCCESIEDIVVPQGLATFGDYAFDGCTSLTSVTLPEGLQTIPEGAFCETALYSIGLPESVKSIEFYAFAECASMKSIGFPTALQEIGSMAFAETPLESIYCFAAIPPAIRADTFDASTYEIGSLFVPSDVVGLYENAEYWKQFYHIAGQLPSTGIGSVASGASIATYANNVVTASGLAVITVHDASGARVLHADGVASLSLEDLPCGLYIIGVEQGGQREVLKVMR